MTRLELREVAEGPVLRKLNMLFFWGTLPPSASLRAFLAPLESPSNAASCKRFLAAILGKMGINEMTLWKMLKW